jgi:hypothetical protein
MLQVGVLSGSEGTVGMAIQLTGWITESGKLEVELPAGLEPGPVQITIESIDPEQAWFWTPNWQAGEKETDEDIMAGRYKDFASMDDLISDLKTSP